MNNLRLSAQLWDGMVDRLRADRRLVELDDFSVWASVEITFLGVRGRAIYQQTFKDFVGGQPPVLVRLTGPALRECALRVAVHLAGGGERDDAAVALAAAAGSPVPVVIAVGEGHSDGGEVTRLLFGEEPDHP